MPDLIIGGAPRSGTTFLCEVLDKHPGVFVGKPFIPEPKVLTREHPDGEAGYRAAYRALFADAPPGTLRVEKTSNYFEQPEARDRIAALLPGTRVLFVLREPVARAFSNWAWSTRNGLETLPFGDAIAREDTDPRALPERLRYARPFDYLARSRYGELAEAWIGALGRDRVVFVPFEPFVTEPERAVLALQERLGLEPLPWARLSTGIVNPSGGRDILDEAVAAELRERLRPDTERFGALTGLDLSAWAPARAS